ncbi:MAG: pyrroloquinoline quinone-dependent dehydrogenase, partial [Planctomycetes bacterium]|nr:pyrroloquinoline quinone-dependent dehydrogenase [Planctomycetota bacterium]
MLEAERTNSHALRAEAIELLKQYEYGPLFTPPSFGGTLMVPGYGGGANWMGGAFDPETGMLYVPSMTSPLAVRVGKGDPNRTNLAYHRQRGGGPPEGPHGLPLIKPPYGRITAFDLNKGEKVWRATNGGDGPRD